MTRSIPSPPKISTTGASNEFQEVIDGNKAFELSNKFGNRPTDLCYHRFYDEEADTEHEIYVPPGKEQEILDLHANEEWHKLRQFPPFSDRACPHNMTPNVVAFQQADGTYKQLYVPEDDAKQARAGELMIAEDYKTLEEEFETWNNQPHSIHKKHEEWVRGVERCAYVRQAAKREADNTSA